MIRQLTGSTLTNYNLPMTKSKVLTDEQRLEAIRVVQALKLLKITKARQKVFKELANESNYHMRLRLEKEMQMLDDDRDKTADLLTLTFD